MALTQQDQMMVALYIQARLKVHTEKLLEHCANIDKAIAAVNTEETQREIRKLAARQAIIREILYGAKYLLSQDVYNKKISFDKQILDPNFYSNRKKEELEEQQNAK